MSGEIKNKCDRWSGDHNGNHKLTPRILNSNEVMFRQNYRY